MTGESARRILAGVDAGWRRRRAAADELRSPGLETLTPAGWLATVTDAEPREHAEYFGQIAKHLGEHLPELQALPAHKSVLSGRGQ